MYMHKEKKGKGGNVRPLSRLQDQQLDLLHIQGQGRWRSLLQMMSQYLHLSAHVILLFLQSARSSDNM